MKQIKEIDGIAIKNMRNATHQSFNQRCYDRMAAALNLADALEAEEAGQTKLGISKEDLDGYQAAISAEQQHNNRQVALRDTGIREAIDLQRDRYITYILDTVRTSVNSPDPATAEAANDLIFVIRPYNGIQNRAMNDETTLVRGLIKALREQSAALSQITGLQDAVDKLEETNDSFAETTEGRTDLRVEADKQDSKLLRQQTDAYYDFLARCINGAYMVSEAGGEEETTAATLIAQLNAIIKETEDQMAREGGKNTEPEEKPTEPTDPDPEEPTDPDEGGDEGEEEEEEGGTHFEPVE